MNNRPITAQHTPRLMALLMASMVTIAVGAQPTRLVLNIIVDGLNLDNLDDLSAHFTDGGFNRLTSGGVTLENIDFGTNLDNVAATAMIVTGGSPSVNSVASSTRYNTDKQILTDVFDDGTTIGNYTSNTYSPASLTVTTLADEIRIAGAGVTYSHAIAPDAMTAILLGGHSANSAVWINDKTANWASTTFYKEFPTDAANANRLTPLSTRLDTMTWVPDAISGQSANLPSHLTKYPFRYTFAKANPDRVYNFKSSPLVNREITRLATRYINSMALGTHDGADVLSLAYTLKPYPGTKNSESRYELIDSYIKLDQDLAQLLNTIDSRVGLSNTLIVITGTPPPTTRRLDGNKWNIPGGQFSTRKAESLLNMYLMAKYGNGRWVTAYHDKQFYLDIKKAEKEGHDPKVMRNEAALFVERMSGVKQAFTIDELLTGSSAIDPTGARRRNIDVTSAGDIFIEIIPGWQLIDDYNHPSLKQANPTAKALTTAPAIIYGPNIKPQRLTSTIDARAIAPTVTRILRIRSPNGAEVAPLSITR